MSILNLLLKQKESVQRSIDNILKAIERGIVTDSTKERLELLDRQKSELETKIMTERARGQLQIQEVDIVKFLKTAQKKRSLAYDNLACEESCTIQRQGGNLLQLHRQ